MCACTRLLTGFWMLYTIPVSYAISCSFCPQPSLSLATHSHCVLCWLRDRTYQNCKSLSSIHTAVTMNTQHLTGPRHLRSTPYTGSLHITEAEAEYFMNPGLVRQVPTHPPPSLAPPYLCDSGPQMPTIPPFSLAPSHLWAMVHRSPHPHHPVWLLLISVQWSTDAHNPTTQSGSSSSLCQWFLLWQLCCPLYKPQKRFLALTTDATCISGWKAVMLANLQCTGQSPT